MSVQIYCIAEDLETCLKFEPTDSIQQIREACLALRKAGNEKKHAKLYHHSDASIIPIGQNIPKNTPETRYKLVFLEGLSISDARSFANKLTKI
jgi:hypothetical protein